MHSFVGRHRLSSRVVGVLAAFVVTLGPAAAQDDLLRPGEAFATRFSGTATVNGPDGKPLVVIDPAGTVGSIVDLRAPGQRPAGEHWFNEPQRKFVTAREVGQVFGVALDTAGPPNIYLAATSAFGLHRSPDNAQWMDAMWGAGGGPGTVYRLDRDTGYRPRVFADITLNGRPNSGPGLGNIAFDKWNQQLFVSDLETGMIHRLRAADGADLGVYDHGTQGRVSFLDAERGQPGSLPPIPFDPASQARITDCPTGKFDNSPECWNFAASGRRIWGLAAWRHPMTGETRLYYSVWSSPAFGDPTWDAAADEGERRNSIWSVRLAPDGGFVPSDVRREFLLPDFFRDPAAIARAGYSSPVSDITFPECGGTALMLLGERGGIRNLGLEAIEPFAAAHEARALQAGMSQQGSWRVLGRYDVGFYNRRLDGEPYVRANCAGGIAFGPDYSPTGMADLSRPDQFTWISGDSLCSVDGPCNNPAAMQPPPGPQPPAAPGAQMVSDPQSMEPDDSEVHGLQGMPVGLLSQIIAPPNANDQAAGVDQAYLIDIDINVDAMGAVIPDTLLRNDATKIGDLAIYQICDAPPVGAAAAFMFPILQVAHWPVFSHSRSGTHNPRYSHHRHGTHNPKFSHERERSHTRIMTHYRHISRPQQPGITRVHPPSLTHNRELSQHRTPKSHNPRVSSDVPVLSHNRRLSHPPQRTHNPRLSHLPQRSHDRKLSKDHSPQRSHNTRVSKEHPPQRSHNPNVSGEHPPTRSHNPQVSGPPVRIHNPRVSRHSPARSHSTRISGHKPVGSHSTRISGHKPVGSHNVRISGHRPVGSHNVQISNSPALRLGPGLQGPRRGGFGPGGPGLRGPGPGRAPQFGR